LGNLQEIEHGLRGHALNPVVSHLAADPFQAQSPDVCSTFARLRPALFERFDE
jgi:hypothetical protein